MRVVRTISADEVTATFLRGGLESPRFHELLADLLAEDGVDASVVAEPDLADADANDYRRNLLGRWHAWLSGPHAFGEFPGSLHWRRVLLTREEVLGILYIDWDWWLTISDGTRLPLEAARRIRAGEIDGVTRRRARADRYAGCVSRPTARADRGGGGRGAAARRDRGSRASDRIRALSGRLPDELEVLLGVAEGVEHWTLY